MIKKYYSATTIAIFLVVCGIAIGLSTFASFMPKAQYEVFCPQAPRWHWLMILCCALFTTVLGIIMLRLYVLETIDEAKEGGI